MAEYTHQPSTWRQVWIDTDPGVDDWLAWLLLQHQPGVTVAGVSVVAGNAPLALTLNNALRIRAWHGWQVPVHAGEAHPLGMLPGTGQVTAQQVLGDEALATVGQRLPPTATLADGHDGVQALMDHLRSPAGPQTLIVALGPLTNLARAWQRDPAALRRAACIAWMGGSTDRGNHTPAAEFNAAADPEAAALVLGSGLPVWMLGLNLCRQLQLTQGQVVALREALGPRATMVLDHLDAYQRIASPDGTKPMALYDPVVALWCRAPGLFEFARMPVDVELLGEFTRGMTVCDPRNRQQRPAWVQVGQRVDAEAAMRLFSQSLELALRESN